MTGRRAIWIGGSLAALALAVSVPAHAMRCGHKVISRGDHAAKLLHYCGEPTFVHTRHAQRTVIGNFGVILPGFLEDVWIEEWTYNLGPNKLVRIVRVENGVVARITHLGYGYR